MLKLQTTPKVKSLTGSKKKTFTVFTSNSVSPTSGWSGGSCEYHSLMDFKTNKELPLFIGNQFNVSSKEQPLELNSIMITTSVFNGKPGWPRITCREDQVKEVLEFLGNPVEEKD